MPATNIVSLINQFVTPEMLDRVASALGLDRAVLQKAVGAGVPGILAALTSVVGRPGGATKIENAIDQQEPGLVTNVVNALGTGRQGGAVEEGLSSLSSVLGGSITSTLTSAINRYAGVGDTGARGLLGLLSPLVLGVLGKQQSVGGAGGVAQLLEQQKDNIARALPPSFANYLSGTGILDQLPGTAASAQAARPRPSVFATEDAGRNWVLPVLGALALLGLGWYLLSRSGDHTVANAPPAETHMQAQSLDGRSFVVAEPDVGKWLHVPVYSNDNKKVGEIVELIRDPQDKVTDFYMDTESTLGIGGQRYHVSSERIREVKPDGVVLTLSESDVKAMPSASSEHPKTQTAP